MMIPATWQTPLAVLGLALLSLMAGILVQRYQQYKAYQRATIRALFTRAAVTGEAMQRLSRVPLSASLRSAVWAAIAEHYRKIRRLHRRYPDIDRLEQEARARVESDGGMHDGRVPAIDDPSEFTELMGAMESVIRLLGSRELARRNRAQAASWVLEARERRAEISARHFIVRAHRAQVQGDGTEARNLLHSVLAQLHREGPDTPFVRELYGEIEGMYSRVLKGWPMLEESGSGPDQRSNSSSAA